jgi:GH24 family phage-related lysozyme (muramidase)
MTTLWLAQDIKTDEGCRLEAYPDPATGAAPWTIGYGHTGKNGVVRPNSRGANRSGGRPAS